MLAPSDTPFEISAYADRIKFLQDGKVICQYDRAFGRIGISLILCTTSLFLLAKLAPCATGHRSRNDLSPTINRVQRKLGKVPTAKWSRC